MEVAKMAGQSINVNECGGCGGRHENVTVTEYSTPRTPYTHWFSCPTTQDPVSLSIVQEGGEDVSLMNEVIDSLAKAQASGRWLTAIFRIEDDMVHIDRKVSSNYPYADLQQSVSLLAKNLGEIDGPPPAQAMPEADALPPSVNLFGN